MIRRDITRRLGLDVGDMRIGLALSDPEGILASPLTIIERTTDEQALEAIVDIVRQNQVGQIIVGLPRRMDGSLGGQAEKTTDFARRLGCCTGVPLEFRDERLTTVSARRLQRAADIKKAKRREHDDAMAAALILQGYLEEGR